MTGLEVNKDKGVRSFVLIMKKTKATLEKKKESKD